MMMRLLSLLLLLLPFSAQAASLLEGGGSKGPIEIASDNLAVEQAKNTATFTGNVIAVQGEMRLKSDRMVVHYRKKEGEAAQAGATQEQQSVSKIEVEGNVFLANPDETAEGDRGVYDVDKDEIRLLGNVVLTRAQNILKGEAMIYNMTTGQSVMTNGATATSPGKPTRVRALFVPKDKEKKAGAETKDTTAP